MGIYNVQSPYAANLRSIKRMEEEARQEKRDRDRASKRRWKEDLRESRKAASADVKAAERELRADTLWRQVKAHFEPKGKGTISKFLWHGDLRKGGPIKAQPAETPPGVDIKKKQPKTLTVEESYNIALQGEPIPPDAGDPNLAMIQKQLQEQIQGSLPGLPDVPTHGGRQFLREPIPGAGPGAAPPPGATGVGGPLPFAQPLTQAQGGGFDITDPAQAMLSQYPGPSAEQQVPLQHLYKQIGALGGGKGGGKSKMDDLTGFAQALASMGMGDPTRDEMASIFGASKGATGIPAPKGGIKGEGGKTAGARTRPAGTQTSRTHLSSLAQVTKDPAQMQKIAQQLALIGKTFRDIEIDKDGPYVTHPNGRKMRFTQVEGVR